MRSTVARRIEEVRLAKKMSRARLAKRLDTTRMRVWRIETGSTGLDVGELPRWARALGVDVSELYGRAA